MKISLTITGPLRKPSGEAEMTINVDEGKNIQQILMEIGYREDELEQMLSFLNDKPVSMSERVRDKDKLVLTILVGGG